MTEPTILVKKADGSTERVPFSSVGGSKKHINKKSRSQSRRVPPDGIPSTKKLREKTKKQDISNGSAGDLVVNQIKQNFSGAVNKSNDTDSVIRDDVPMFQVGRSGDQSFAAESASSDLHPLEEKLEDHELIDPALANITTNDELVDEIMQNFPVSLPGEIQLRARSLVVSYLRGLREKHSVHEYAVQSIEAGGLGLSDTDAARLVVVMDEEKEQYHAHEQKQIETFVPAKKTQRQEVLPHDILVRTTEALATTTPVKDVFVDMAASRTSDVGHQKSEIGRQKSEIGDQVSDVKSRIESKKKLDTLIEGSARASVSHELAQTLIKQRSELKHRPRKPALHDVAPMQKPVAKKDTVTTDVSVPEPEEINATLSPIDELQQFSIVDFRRIGTDPEILLSKFDGLRDESYLLYMQARRAWFGSPLFMAYQNILVEAINSGKKIADIFLGQKQMPDSLKESEFKALIQVNNRLHV